MIFHNYFHRKPGLFFSNKGNLEETKTNLCMKNNELVSDTGI